MKRSSYAVFAISLVLLCGFTTAFAQSNASGTNNNGSVPSLINYSGVLKDGTGKALTSIAGVTFLIYTDEQGGSPLWLETQSVTPDHLGRYTVELGAASPHGLPSDVFQNGEARWLAIQVAGEAEQQPRVVLLSVPYAMKAGDAATVGGLPPSAFVMANSSPNHQGKANPATETENYIPLFTNNSGGLGNSILYQSGTTSVGIGTTTPAAKLEVNGTAKFDNLVTFSSTQTFPGTLTGITAGTGITVSGTKTDPTVAINTTFTNGVYAQLGAANTFTKNQSTKGELAAGGTAGGHTANGTVEVDAGDTNNGTYSPGLNFGGGGEAIASNRAGTTNQYGIDFYTNYIRQMSVTNSGLVGIGTATPSHLFEVDAAATNAQMAMVSSGTDAAISVKNTASGGREYWIDSGSGAAGIGSGNFAVYDATAGATRLAINSGGNVGIGTTSPLSPLDVETITPDPSITVNNTDGGAGIFSTTNGALAVYAVSNLDQTLNAGVSAVAGGATQENIGVWGYAASPIGIGSYSEGNSASVTGQGWLAGIFSIGSWGDTGYQGGIGVLATADNAGALTAVNNSVGFTTAQFQNNTSVSGSLVLETAGPQGDKGPVCTIDVSGNLTCDGTITGKMNLPSQGKKVALYSVAAAENWFEDAGSGQLSNGTAVIHLDDTFAQTVNTGVEYHVFLTPNGDCHGLYVSHETATSFEVHELAGGTSNIAFDWRIMAKRVGFETVRLEESTRPEATEGPWRRSQATHGPNPDDVRKARMEKMAELRKAASSTAPARAR